MNDEFGHEAGDALLRSAANHLNFWNNHGDVYRMGGDEFMVVVKNQTPEAMNKLVNMWYPTVGQLNRDTDGFKCVLSYGLAFGTKGCNFDSLQKQADDKMYEMKVALKKKFGEPLR
jgi:diguanylate cyclase (GGDEF)-like protein